MSEVPQTDGARLERLWAGQFGRDYIARNVDAGVGRETFWRELLGSIEARTVLEVGCNVGANLRWLASILDTGNVYGVDVNAEALAHLRSALPGVNSVRATARHLPFRDAEFDLTFTTGVLIHVAPDVVPLAMGELVRCSRRYVLCGEYFSERLTEVPYREQEGALFKRDFGGLYRALFPELRQLRSGLLGRDEGWDNVTWWLFEKT